MALTGVGRRPATSDVDGAATVSARVRLRLGLIWTIGTLLTLIAGGVFDQIRWELIVAPLLPVAAVYLTVARSWTVRTVAITVAVIITTALIAWLSAGSLAAIDGGIADGPRRLLTTEWPSPVEPTLVAALGLLLASISAIAAALAADDRFHLLPLVPLLAGLTCLLALSAPQRPAPWQLAGLGIAALGLGLSGTHAGRRSLTTDRTVPVITLGVVLVAIATAGGLTWADRASPRATDPAELSAVLLDPIEAMVALRQADPPVELLQITEISSPAVATLPSRWRVAALDDYDGQRWVPQLTLRPIGGTLTSGTPTPPGSGATIRYEIEYLTPDLDTIAFPGRPISVATDVETDVDRVVVRLQQRPRPGDTVTVVSGVAPLPGEAATAPFVARQVDQIAARFTAVASGLAGEGTAHERLKRVEAAMRTDWRLDPSAPGGGQQLALLERFATETRRGTNEQFVTTFVLFARSLGLDARVATGFLVAPEQRDRPLTIDSTQAAVWPEVQLEQLGWLAFDPVPASIDVEPDEPPPPPQAQSPAAAQPPIAEPAEPVDDVDDNIVDDRASGAAWESVRTWLTRFAAVGGLTLLPFVVVFGTVVAIKWRRRHRRLGRDQPGELVRGVWANTTDALVDAGLSIAPSWTDDRIATRAAPLAPGAPHEMRRLASMATAVTFGQASALVGSDARRLTDDALLTGEAVVDAIRAPLTRWQRVKWWLSVRSIRSSTRSPVEV